MKGLCDVVDEHAVALRHDFQAIYGLDLVDVWRGKLSRTRALDLIQGLAYEPNSRYRTQALGDESFHGWGRLEAAVADLIDAVQQNTHATIKVGGGKASSPDPYPRPEVTERSWADIPEMPAPEELTIRNFPIHAVVAMTSK